MFNRSYAVAIVRDSQIVRIPARRIHLAEARAWVASYGRIPAPDGSPCILHHPISRATVRASAKSRSA